MPAFSGASVGIRDAQKEKGEGEGRREKGEGRRQQGTNPWLIFKLSVPIPVLDPR